MQHCDEYRVTRKAVIVPDRIMVATDLEDLDFLLVHVIAQAKAAGSAVTILHAISPMYVASMEAAGAPYDCERTLIREVHKRLEKTVCRLILEGIAPEISVRIGRPADVIREQLCRSHGSRLIMGTHARGVLGRFAKGSVAHDLIPWMGVPTFVVGPHSGPQTQHATPRRILHPVSLSGDYQEDCRLAMELAAAHRAELTLLHVLEHDMDDTVNPQRLHDWAETALRQMTAGASDPAAIVHTRVVFGKVVDEIANAARDMDVDWIVLSTNQGKLSHRPKQTRIFDVLAEAPCPVFMLG